ncbi:uncharacterized protein LOC143039056 [Oratosquilla oratoria]|uniref:uncharacterized protein LOC143039056 n=1 Tax=Oratosquilla oratoria TaxID=337810 RepID=UPI003F7717A2
MDQSVPTSADVVPMEEPPTDPPQQTATLSAVHAFRAPLFLSHDPTIQSSVATCLQELLSKEELGNERPSDLLRRMKNLLADKYDTFDKTLFLQLFYQRLPATIQRSLFTVKGQLPVEKLATLEDELIATVSSPSVSHVKTDPLYERLVDVVTQVALQFGSKARNCNQPCAFTHSPTLNSNGEHEVHNVRPSSSQLLFIKDPLMSHLFLIGTGAVESILPATAGSRTLTPLTSLYTTNKTKIDVFRKSTLTPLSLNLRRAFEWTFYVTDVSQLILGADFLNHYGLLVDIQRRRLYDVSTHLSSYGHTRPSIPVHPDGIPKTAITTPFGLYEYVRMPFGLKNAAQTFQRFIDEVLRGLPFCFAYIDDLLIASPDEATHRRHRLRDYEIQINAVNSKSVFASVAFFGHTVSFTGTSPLSTKCDVIHQFPKPSTQRQLKPCKRGQSIKFAWCPEADEAFASVKTALDTVATLSFLAPEALTSITIDASNDGIGAVLQQYVDSAWKPLAFFSKKLSKAEKNYGAFDRELLAVYQAVQRFRYFLEGQQFIIFTDHKPLTTTFHANKASYAPTQLLHLRYISQFSTDIRYVQVSCHRLRRYCSSTGQLRRLAETVGQPFPQVPGTDIRLYADVSTGNLRPFLPTSGINSSATFMTLHTLASVHPNGCSATYTSISSAPSHTPAATKAIPIPDINTDTVARAFVDNCIARFGVPTNLTSDRGSQFKSTLWNKLWSVALSLVLLGIRTSLKVDIGYSPAELVFGITLRLPGEFVADVPHSNSCTPHDFAVQLKETMAKLHPVPPLHAKSPRTFVSQDLLQCTHVFVRTDTVRKALQPPYEGPFEVMRRTRKTVTIRCNGKRDHIPIDRVKPAYLFDPTDTPVNSTPIPTPPKIVSFHQSLMGE